jgi:hypothetical protein
MLNDRTLGRPGARTSSLGYFKMDDLGVALVAGGVALLCGGLVFLIPVERKLSSSQQTFATIELYCA